MVVEDKKHTKRLKLIYSTIINSYISQTFFNHINNITMSAITDKIKGNWNVIKGSIKQEFAEASDEDLAYQEGQEDELLGRLQILMGKTKEEVKDFIDKF